MRWPVAPRTAAIAAGVVLLLAVVLTLHACAGGSSPPRSAAPRSAAPVVDRPRATPHPGAATPGASSGLHAADPLEACAEATVAGLSPAQRAGQLVMVGTQVTDPTALTPAVQRYHLGGVFLAGRASPTAGTLRQGILALQRAAGAVPLQLGIDQEGGEVQTLKGPDFPVFPTAVEQGKWDQATLRARTADWAGRLARAGVTLDLAPVADTVPAGTEAQNPPIGAFDRQYGSSPDAVAADIGTVVSAAQGAGILTTLKHFPGLGRVTANTDTSTSAVDAALTAGDPYLKPFARGIAAGTGAVMISSARYPKLDPDAVAAFSAPIITGLLRDRMGFTGLVISDDLGAAVAVKSLPVGQRAVRFVQAGGDMALTVQASDAGPMTAALTAAAQASPAFAARVTAAATDVVRSKYRAGLLTCRH